VRIFLGAKRFGLFLVSFAFLAGLIGATPVNAVSGPNSTPSYESLFSSGVVSSPESLGRVERDAVKAAKAHLVSHAKEWDIDPTQFQASEAINGVAGMSTVRFTQSIYGVEVANSLLAVTVDKNGSLLSFNKLLSNYYGQSESVVSQSAATEIIKSKLSSDIEVGSSQVIVSEPELVILDSALVDNIPSGKYLAWRANTSIANNATSISLTYLSQDGEKILSSLPYVRGITADPFVCDLQIDVATPGYVLPTGVTSDSSDNRYVNISSTGQGMPLCGVNTFGLGAPATEVGKSNIVRTWDYFNTVLGQDINEEKYLGNIAPNVNGDSIPRISAFVDICVINGTTRGCPYGNAFWVPWISSECGSGACSGIFLGKDFDHADDVIAHELAHGVTFSLAFDSAMVDSSETAALSEAISDIFGEAMDQLSVLPGESADPGWNMGEDAKAGGFRGLRNPSVLKIDSRWAPGDSHDNSGPVNRLAYLLANGGKSGNVKVKALGTTANSAIKNDLCEVDLGECTATTRMSQLVFATTSNLSATSDYFDFGKQMMNACTAFVKNKTPGFTDSSCKNVGAALKAQGFTKFKIVSMTQLGTVSKGKDTRIVAKAFGPTGEPIVGQKMTLQIKRGSTWKSIVTATTNSNGKVAFIAAWNKSSTYRVVSRTNSGVFSASSKIGKVTVR
jgi:Zn-dependent metalloprotease